jgi:hypothetical protein
VTSAVDRRMQAGTPMTGGVIDHDSIRLCSAQAGCSGRALTLPAGHLIVAEQRWHLLQSEYVFVRAGQRVIGLAAYQADDDSRRLARSLLGDRSLDPPNTQLALDILIIAPAIAALRDDIESLTLVVLDRALLPGLVGHGYRRVLQTSHEVCVQKTVCDESRDSAA